jgi:hypothetical protein
MDNFTLSIKLGNEAMQAHADVARELRAVAAQMEQQTDMDGTIYDENGNSVGSFRFTGPRPLGWEGTGAGSIGALRETAEMHAEAHGSLERFAEGEEPNEATLEEAVIARNTVDDEGDPDDLPRLDELIEYLRQNPTARCPVCGLSNGDDATLCAHCGGDLSRP